MPKSRSESGAISVMFALFLGSGILILLLGLVVDGGELQVKRLSAQNAADSLSNAYAQHCAKSAFGADCLSDTFDVQSTNLTSISSSLSQEEAKAKLANASGGNYAVITVCGKSSTWSGIPGCANPTGGSRDCLTDLGGQGYANWVRVYTSSDPNGYTPFFANFLSANNAKYIEYSCAQSYWGQAASIPKDTSTAQLPFAIGVCEALAATSGSVVQLVGDNASSSPCASYYDRQNRKYSGGVGTYPGALPAAAKTDGTVNGFISWKTTSQALVSSNPDKYTCWSLQTTCTPVALSNVRSASATSNSLLGVTYSALVQTVMKNSLGKTVLLPVVDKNAGGAYVVKSYVGFTLLGYRMTTTASLTAANAQKVYTDKSGNAASITWGSSCPTPTTTSASCIAGIIGPRVYAPYGQFAKISLTTDAGVPDFGYYIQRQAP